jgi:hypothetical protein
MRTRIRIHLIFIMFAIFSCEQDDRISIPPVDGFTLYWDHDVFGLHGRRLRFEASTTNEFDNDYDLIFNSSIENNSITATLANSVDNGKCPNYPMPADPTPNTCSASGGFYLPDKLLANGTYSLKIVAPTFEITSELIVTDEQVELKIPANDRLESFIQYVYPIPKNLLFGSIIYQGSLNTNDAENFLNELKNLGLIETTVPNHPYRNLSVDENGQPIDQEWVVDNHLIGFLYDLNNVDVKTIFEESKKYFNETDLNIDLFTSNGDEAHLSKTQGITIVYGE